MINRSSQKSECQKGPQKEHPDFTKRIANKYHQADKPTDKQWAIFKWNLSEYFLKPGVFQEL